VIQYLDEETSKDNDSFRNSEWGPEAAQSMCKEVRDFRLPGGVNNDLTMGELIDNTPPHLISKVMLEEKLFETWYHGRTVLIGDGKRTVLADLVLDSMSIQVPCSHPFSSSLHLDP